MKYHITIMNKQWHETSVTVDAENRQEAIDLVPSGTVTKCTKCLERTGKMKGCIK